jgi:AraC-like DNA-binding protein
VETALAMGAPEEQLFENTDLTRQMLDNPEMRVSYTQYGTLVRNALRSTRDPALGLRVGKNIGVARMGPLGFLLPNTPTLGAALNAMIHYSAAVAPIFRLSLDRRDERSTLTLAPTLPMGGLLRFGHEVTLAALLTQAQALCGRHPVPFVRLELPFSEPSHLGLYRELLGDVPIHFDRPAARLEFDSWILDTAVEFADPATFKIAEQVCAQQLLVEYSEEGLMTRVRRLLATEPSNPPALSEVARVLRTSTRTLRRELYLQRTSYKQLVDEVRRARADEWLTSSSMPIDGLARGLGFSTVGSFRRAYKRWTGRTPSAARQRQ